MMKLDERDWKDFAVPEIFQNIQRGKRLKNADHIPGIVPLSLIHISEPTRH